MTIDHLIIAVPAFPLLAALLIPWLERLPARRVANFSTLVTLLTFAAALALLVLAIQDEPVQQLSLSGSDWGLLLFDPLSSLMAAVISGISLIVHMYSVRYMAEEPGYTRFFMLLDLMTAALLLMVAAGDLLTLLTSWHLVGVFLYFLLAHDTTSRPAHRYAFWTFFTYRIGDLPLLIAAALLFDAYGTWSLAALFDAIAERPAATTFFGMPLVEVVGGLVALAAFARSAQFFLHTWLPYTMSGPTPVSALMHAGIVNAGGFLINRFAPLYVHTHDVLHLVFVVGLVTAVVGSMLMLSQNDIKKALGYSTMGQMGFMIMECGVGAFSLAVYHLIAHGLFKGTLFLSSGGVINEARIEDGVPKHELYTFVVERRASLPEPPWLAMVVVTLAVPLLILITAHLLVAQDYFQKQGAIVLLFFGWVTGAQLIFATYKMRAANPWRLVALIVASFAIVVLGYVLISHVFDLFLYPDEALRAGIYDAAGVDLIWFDILVGVVTLVIILGWALVYYADHSGRNGTREHPLWLNFYALVVREFYIMDLYAWLTRRILGFAARLNVWLRWV